MKLRRGADAGSPRTSAVRVPQIVGLHHVRLPVSNVLVSRDWYLDVLGFECVLVEEEEDRVTGVVLEHPSGVVIGLHEQPDRASALRGFVVVGLAVSDATEWVEYLDRCNVVHGQLDDRHLGQCLRVADPDGMLIELHTLDQPSADEA